MPRLYIGTYIIDAADTSSSSTTSGVKLAFDAEEPFKPRIENTDFKWPGMFAYVTAASESALKTAVEAVLAAIRNCSGLTIKYEETNATTLFEQANTLWPQCESEVEIDQGQLTAEIAFSFTGKQTGPVSAGGGLADEPGLNAPIIWEYIIAAGGIAGMTAQAVFGPTLSGASITAGARENAVAWINKMKASGNYPAWLGAAFDFAGAKIEFEQKQNVGTVGESSYDPARVSLIFTEQDSTLHAAGINANVIGATWNVDVSERDPLNTRAGALPGKDIILFGDFTIKTEGNTAFNSSDSKVADADIYSTAAATVELIITMFRSIYSAMSLLQWGNAVIKVDPRNGACTYNVLFTGDVSVRSWEEHGEIKMVEQKTYDRATDGSDWKFEMEGGPILVLTHSLTIKSAGGAIPYKKPSLDSNWDEMESGVTPTTTLGWNNGQAEYTTSGTRMWRYMNPGPRSSQGDSIAQNPSWDSIGNGRE